MKWFFYRRSIAFRLIAAVLAVEALFAVLLVVLSFGYERHTHFTAFGVMLHGRADTIMGAIQDSEDKEDTLIISKSDLRLPGEDIWQALDQDGTVLGRSANWVAPESDSRAKSRDGTLSVEINGRHYAVLEMHGTRFVDPDAPDGGKLHQVTVFYGAPTDRVWHAIRGGVEFYAAGSLLLLAITGPLIAWLLHRGLSPVRELANLAAQVSANSWQFSPPESARTTPELAPLTLAMENVLARLEKAFRQQRVFVSDAAHELKTAVAVIKSSLQVLTLRPRSNAEYEDGLERCLTDAERLEGLVGAMLTLARVESAEGAAAAPASCEIASRLDEVVLHLGPLAELRGVRLNFSEGAARGISVAMSGEDCFILLSNLVLNAVQHSSNGTVVDVIAETDEGGVSVSVRDRGEGVDAAALPHVFDRFFRGDPSRARSTGGAGLGLAISKAIVERAGGEVSLENNADHGATAVVWLPAVAGEREAAARERASAVS